MGTQSPWLERTAFGRTGLRVSRLAIGSSYGIGGANLERAYERGINFFFFGMRRRAGYAAGVRALVPKHRDDLVLAIQSYSRSAMLMGPSVDLALRALRTDYADLMGLGWWNEPPPARIVDAARALQLKGKVRHLVISSHHRPTFERLMSDPTYGGIMLRYSAAHPGAEREVFPLLADPRPGVLAFTATRWGSLMRPELTPPGDKTPTAIDCYRFVLSCAQVDTSLAGPRDGAQLEGALEALERGPMSEDELAWMRRVGVAVRANAKGGSPVDFLDRIGDWFRRRRSSEARAAELPR